MKTVDGQCGSSIPRKRDSKTGSRSIDRKAFNPKAPPFRRLLC